MIEKTIAITFPEHGVVLKGALRYEPADPYAVHLYIFDGAGDVHWVFARELLKQGSELGAGAGVGAGDVKVYTWTEPRVFVRLETREGRAILMLNRRDVLAFLGEAYALVPDGAEGQSADIDKELAELFGGEA